MLLSFYKFLNEESKMIYHHGLREEWTNFLIKKDTKIVEFWSL